MDDRDEILGKVNKLLLAHKSGILGGEKMKISLKINPKYEIPEIHICNSENNAEIRKL